ncbi:hypothetical protein RIF29_38053 [Crotalaria pallida]|uniref:Uncharacterized protein n=1 Tax=Crotalaria pallida TaxID=3830 RepID=A0AAN9DZF5_CROPI
MTETPLPYGVGSPPLPIVYANKQIILHLGTQTRDTERANEPLVSLVEKPGKPGRHGIFIVWKKIHPLSLFAFQSSRFRSH